MNAKSQSCKAANGTIREADKKTESFCLSVLSLVDEYKAFKTKMDISFF